ncbi:adenylosuccinate lyase family protein [Sporichthya sp.]|uniref:class-II fumarase/aspartase family protein n=1 Tax=Sporichthya sp. TaxID=65475 RepID=UPI0017A2BB84|nr:adenylosuccinate lyase family protein [Sporichthya sp.]MBA3745080.1 adenylosuccinate lyase family protein [Sporichthya sp.]
MSSHLSDSEIYGHLWTTPELHKLFDDRGRTQSWLDVLAALAAAQADVGLIPADAAAAIAAGAKVDALDLTEVAAQTRATGHSTLGLIRGLKALLPTDVHEWVYYGATVQDITDTATARTMRTVLDIVDRDVGRCRQACLTLARDHRTTVMCGRTHGQPGLPITFGFKAAIWADELTRHQERIAQARPRLEVVQLGGALGTMEFWGEAALPLLDAFADRTGLAAPDVPWITARDRVAEFTWLLAMVSGTLGKIGNEIFELQRPEIGEVAEPFTPGQVGSITMPHKRNPELAEHLDTLARRVRANAAGSLEGLIALHERDGRSWKAEWLAVPESAQLTGAALGFAARLLAGLQVNAEKMRANLDERRGYLLSEPLMRALSDRIGKHAAHEAVYAAAMAGIDRGVDLTEVLLEQQLLTPDQIEAATDPAKALGAATAFVDRMLKT